jgi:hypothetical protein
MAFPKTIALTVVSACVSVMVLLLVACSSSSGGSKDNAPDGSSSDATADGGGVDTGPPPGQGVVIFSQEPEGGVGSFAAGFALTAASKVPTDCTVLDAGACVTTSCPKATASDASAPDAALPPNAGALTVTGGIFGTTGTGLSIDKAGTYYYQAPGNVFTPGDTLGVAGAGNTVPAFAEQTVVGPATIKLTAPAAAAGKITIPTGQDLVVTWTGGTAGAKVFLFGNAVFTNGDSANLTCSWDASTGTATVPKAALAPMAAGNAEGSDLQWYQAAQTSFSAGAWPITISAYTTQQGLATFQ